MNRSALKHKATRAWLAAPALAGTVASMLLTVAVVALWLGPLIGYWLAVMIGLGFDGAWLAAHSYERRLAAQGDHDRRVTVVGWGFGLAAVGLLVTHALTAGAGTAVWLAVSWLPLAAKSLWWLHGLWEQTEVSPRALAQISRVLQESRDSAALARATLAASVRVERIRMEALAESGATIARVQAKSSGTLADAWAELGEAGEDGQQARALEAVAASASPAAGGLWELPAWTPLTALRPEAPAAGAETASAQVEQVPVIAPARISTAAGVRHLVSVEGITDPKAVMERLPEVTGRPIHNRATVLREIRNARTATSGPESTSSAQPFGFGAGRN